MTAVGFVSSSESFAKKAAPAGKTGRSLMSGAPRRGRNDASQKYPETSGNIHTLLTML